MNQNKSLQSWQNYLEKVFGTLPTKSSDGLHVRILADLGYFLFLATCIGYQSPGVDKTGYFLYSPVRRHEGNAKASFYVFMDNNIISNKKSFRKIVDETPCDRVDEKKWVK
jgi:hypothetical protein